MFDLHDPTFWVGLAFIAFLGLLAYMEVHTALGKSLDDRAAAIKKELDDARRLREEAQALLADYQKKHAEAESEAKAIVDQARHEAQALAAETSRNLKESVERRTKIAEDKIARAEAQAVSEVRAASVDAALAAAERLLKARTTGAPGDALVEESIRDLKARIN